MAEPLRLKGGEHVLEYGKILGLDIKSLFRFTSSEILLLSGLGMVFAVVGYLLKGIWGGIVGLLIGVILFLYLRGSIPY
jgi:hypothetical protein